MVLDTKMVVALKDNESKYKLKKISIFEIKNINKVFPYLKIKIRNNKVIININCPLCEGKHNYSYDIDDLLKKEMIIGGCEVLNSPLFFIGQEEPVRENIIRYKNINNEIYKWVTKK